jgi:NarL family two-component system response regulator LiaR
MKKIKILIVDDHPMMREALQTALADEPDLEVIGEASNGLEALELVQKLTPDLILMDLLMPQMNGLEAVTRILKEQPQVKIMVVSSLEDEGKILDAVQAGALGYFPKSAPRAYLLEGIRKVADGVPYLPAGIAAKLFKGLREMKSAPAQRSAIDEPLTGRQDEILVLVGEGRSDREISETLHLTEATVRSHIHNILQRLGLETRAQLVAYALKNRGEMR